MTLIDLVRWLENHAVPVGIVAALFPLVIGAVSLALRRVATGVSQQIANVGIAVGLLALSLEVVGLGYAAIVAGLDPVRDVSAVLLFAPPWLAVTGFAVEHLVHPGRQEQVRRPIRAVLQGFAALVVVGLVFSVLRIHMVVWTGMFGFIVFGVALIAVFWWVIRRAV